MINFFSSLYSTTFLQIGNALVCLAVWSNHSMRTVTNIFIVNLAVADFFVILFCLPPTVIWDVTETWFLSETMCKVVIYFQVSIVLYISLNVVELTLKTRLSHYVDISIYGCICLYYQGRKSFYF